MTRGSLDAVAVVGVIAMLWIGVERWRGALPERSRTPAVVGSAPDVRGPDPGLPDVDDARVAIDRDPFRLSRLPADVRYADVRYARARTPTAEAAAAPTARPTLTLTGIVGGPPWTAIIDGIPGQGAGTLAREGSSFDNLVVRTVTARAVVVQGPDTTWRLTLTGGRQ